jgi:uncharacterized membrane protein YedE/YeeE
MAPLSPFAALAGGMMIGTAAALLLLLLGRIAGVSGMVAAAARIGQGGTPRGQAMAFVLALPLGALAASALLRAPQLEVTGSLPLLVAGGLLVGFGTRLGSGCTSGHGVCGMARLSPRSIAATLVFMAAGVATVFATRHLLGG